MVFNGIQLVLFCKGYGDRNTGEVIKIATHQYGDRDTGEVI